MSMMGDFISVSPAELESYLQDSSRLETLLDAILEDRTAEAFTIGKSFDGLSYLLTGKSSEQISEAKPPLSLAIFGGQKIDPDQDLGYGPAGFLTPDQVKEVNAALAPITRANLEKNYDAGKMEELGIYPGGWEDKGTSLEWLGKELINLQSFYADAAAKGMAVVMLIS